MAEGTWKSRANEIARRMRGMPFEAVHQALKENRDQSVTEQKRLIATDEELAQPARTIANGGDWRWI